MRIEYDERFPLVSRFELYFGLVIHAYQIVSILDHADSKAILKYDHPKEGPKWSLSRGLTAARDAAKDSKDDNKEGDQSNDEHDGVSSVKRCDGGDK